MTVKLRFFAQNYIGWVEVQFGAGILPGWVTSGHGLRRDKDLLRLGQQTDAQMKSGGGGDWFMVSSSTFLRCLASSFVMLYSLSFQVFGNLRKITLGPTAVDETNGK